MLSRRLLTLSVVDVFVVLQLAALACGTPYRVDERNAETLSQAFGHLEEERFTEAESVLGEIDISQLNAYERALVYQMLGHLESEKGRYKEALVYFEKCLAEDALPKESQTSLRFSAAQLYVTTEQFEKAVTTLEMWFEEVETTDASAYYLLAVAYYQTGKIEQAVVPAKKAVDIAKTPREPWLQLLVTLYMEEKEYRESLAAVEQLVSQYPKEEYWTQLGNHLAVLDRWEELANLLNERTVEVADWVVIRASADGRSEVVTLLAARGADLDATGDNELTALHQAARGGHEETVRVLLDLGADPSATDASGRTAAQLASESGHQALARLLLHATRRD